LHDDESKIDSTLCDWFREVLVREAEAIQATASRCDAEVAQAVKLLEGAGGHVVVTGMGKMGCVARKAAATLSSTGTPAIFLDPADAMHGSLGKASLVKPIRIRSHQPAVPRLLWRFVMPWQWR